MGSPLGPLLANAFLCHIEETLENRNLLPSYYKRYVDDTLAVMRDQHAAQDFLHVLNACHPSIQFTMELSLDGKLPFLGILLEKRGNRIMTSVHRKPTNKGLLLHYQSHQDNRYKKSLLVTMIHRAYSLSSTIDLFNKECNEIKTIFHKLQYPSELVENTIKDFQKSLSYFSTTNREVQDSLIRIVLPFIDQKSADSVKHQLNHLNKILNADLQPVFTSQKLENVLKIQEQKPPLVNQQLVVYYYKCGSCDADYVGYTARHLHQRKKEHQYSAIGKQCKQEHGFQNMIPDHCFTILKKCKTKFDCLIYEMLFIKEKSPSLNTQSDSVKAELFT